MLLKFLGNGSAFNAKRKCNSAYFIANNSLYLFDCGGDIFKEIINKDLLNNITNINIIITHFHPDHIGSLGDLIFYNFFIHKAKFCIFVYDNIIPLLNNMGITSNMYNVQLVNPSTVFKIGSDVYILSVAQEHVSECKSCGYVINYNGKKIFYSGDSKSIPSMVLENIESFDEIYQDTCGLDYENNPHLSFNKLKTLIKPKYRNKIFCMHLDNNISENEILNEGFNVAILNNEYQKIAIYPGSFDPVTKGHLHIINKASKLFDKVIVLVANNSKKTSTFTLEEKINMLNLSIKEQNVQVMSTNDLTVNIAKNVQANYIIRGLRNSTDFEYEQTINLINKKLEKNIETVFLIPDEEYLLMSSSTARELLSYKCNVDWILPNEIIDLCKKKYEQQ